MRTLTTLLHDCREFRQIMDAINSRGECVAAEGVSGAGKALLVAAAHLQTGRTTLVITYSYDQASRFTADLQALTAVGDDELGDVCPLPATESVIYDGAAVDARLRAERLEAFDRLLSGAPVLGVTTINAALQRLAPAEAFRANQFVIATGDELDRDDLTEHLLEAGYRREEMVEDVGQFSARGGIVDIFPPSRRHPVRVEFFGDEVESIRQFDLETQRSVVQLASLSIGPAGEAPLTRRAAARAEPLIRNTLDREAARLRRAERFAEADRLTARVEQDLERIATVNPSPTLEHYLPYLYDHLDSVLDYLPEDALLVIDEPVRLKSHADQFEAEVQEAYQARLRRGEILKLPHLACSSLEELSGGFGGRSQLCLTMLAREVPWAPDAQSVRLPTPPVDSFGGQLDLLADGVHEWQRTGHRVIVASPQARRVAELFGQRDLKCAELGAEEELRADRVHLSHIPLSSGFKLPPASLVVLTDSEIFGWHKLRRPKRRRFQSGVSVTSLSELAPGDYVVHLNHGVGVYQGLVKQTVQDVERDYLLIKYAGEDKLYVPVTQIDRVQKYIGSDSAGPTIHGLKSPRWQRAKRRARVAARLLAKELLDLYATRERTRGYAFGQDSPWLTEMEQAFKYDETPDQWQAILDIKRDMQRSAPTDRLVCGDVGYGKTEVAVRAAFKAVLDGKQVGVLVPTTVLAQQHEQTFRERLSPYPVNVQMLSRFRTKAQQRRVIEGLKAGTVDIVIGTHRLLQGDVAFKELGLVVIDEEQRFGVRHKERLKQLRASVDVITLTATPIPRTLHMALSGIRDMSIINDPPVGRLPINTYAREHDDDIVREAIVREIERGGQVYYVHNRVQSIRHVAAHVQRLVPSARIAVGHGQQPEDQLEQTMLDFYAGEYDVLVCTTIIESGLDIPNVNTIIIEDSQNLGLAQLYQLRGRVGRANRQAYCYLLYRYPDRMTPEAEQRLQAIQEFSELGSGFKIAMRDLEIRGAGDILGAEQHGHMAAVGFDLYCRMLAEAVRTLRGEHAGDEPEVAIELPVEAVIPGSLVQDESHRIALYRRIGGVRTKQDAEAVRAEIRDRYGEVPAPVENLIRTASLRADCQEVGIVSIVGQARGIVVKLRPDRALSRRESATFTESYRRGPMRRVLPRASFQGQHISFQPDAREDETIFEAVEEIIERLRYRDNAAVVRVQKGSSRARRAS